MIKSHSLSLSLFHPTNSYCFPVLPILIKLTYFTKNIRDFFLKQTTTHITSTHANSLFHFIKRFFFFFLSHSSISTLSLVSPPLLQKNHSNVQKHLSYIYYIPQCTTTAVATPTPITILSSLHQYPSNIIHPLCCYVGLFSILFLNHHFIIIPFYPYQLSDGVSYIKYSREKKRHLYTQLDRRSITTTAIAMFMRFLQAEKHVVMDFPLLWIKISLWREYRFYGCFVPKLLLQAKHIV